MSLTAEARFPSTAIRPRSGLLQQLDRVGVGVRLGYRRALLFLFWSVLACGGGRAGESAPEERGVSAAALSVAVSVPPQAWLVESVGGGRVEITVLVPPGSTPETFEVAPRQMAELARARIVVIVGHPAFPFEDRFLRSLAAPGAEEDGARVVRMVAARETRGRSERSGRETGDPHLWLSPPVMARTARDLAAALADVDPQGAAGYATRLDATLGEIERVESETRRLLADLESRRFHVVHPAWGSFAAHFGLEQVAIEEEGKEPSPSRLASLIHEARAEGVRTLFVQRGVATRSAEVLAEEVGARLVELDPLARDWPAMMLQTARVLAGK